MNRKWLVGGVAAFLALAAVLALVVGGVVGRSIVPRRSRSAAAAPRRRGVRFTDTLTDISIAYPATWVRRIAEGSGGAPRRVVAGRVGRR